MPKNAIDRDPAEQFRLVQEAVRSIKLAASLADVEGVLGETARLFDFDHFALIQRLSARNTTAPIQLTDYPDDWVELLLRNGFYTHDPVLAASERTVAAFAWTDLPALVPMTARRRRFMEAARQQGLGQGYTVPIHVPGEATGLCSFVTSHNREVPASALPAMQYVACYAFEQARRLAMVARGNPPRLTQRQLECVVLAARGKSTWVVGELLGISQQTVHKYLENAKRRYGVSTRTQLIVRALHDGLLSFSDIIGSE